jgi:hypothetical protein
LKVVSVLLVSFLGFTPLTHNQLTNIKNANNDLHLQTDIVSGKVDNRKILKQASEYLGKIGYKDLDVEEVIQKGNYWTLKYNNNDIIIEMIIDRDQKITEIKKMN